MVVFGIPFQYTKSQVLLQRLSFLRETHNVQEQFFLASDALKNTAQCVGRVVRSKNDYGIMIFADSRYKGVSHRSKLPPWITDHLQDSNLDLSTEEAVSACRSFLRTIAQPVDESENTQLLGPAEIKTLMTSSMDNEVEVAVLDPREVALKSWE